MIKQIIGLNLRTIANSGQCFRIYEVSENVFNVLSTNRFLRVNALNNNKYDFECSNKEFEFYKYYFDLNTNYKKFSSICKSNDKYLKKCIEFSDGLRILNQDKFETIISFIISQRKSVKAIQTSIERLCESCGNFYTNKYGSYYSFPSAEQILKTKKSVLCKCGLGYRLDYIIEFCIKYIDGQYDLNKYTKLDSKTLLNELMKIRGVGIKVASCIALFAYHRLDICPMDVWIKRVINNQYKGKLPKEYLKYAGIIQQFWFNYSRNTKIV